MILERRNSIYQAAKAKHPERWSGETRNWNPVMEVALNPENFIRAGYSANADIVLEKKEKVLTIKESNLIVENDTSFVEVQRNNDEFEKILVETGISDGVNVEVLSGLTEADQIKKL